MELLIFVIPFLTAIYLLVYKRRETVWWEYLVLIVPSLLLALGFEFVFKKANVSDTEYLGDYVVKLRHEDRWNEYIRKTCTRRVRCGGTHKHPRYRTVRYDCSYVQDHPERWIYYTKGGHKVYTDRELWTKIKNRFQAPRVWIDMKRRYHTIDGDAQEYTWSGQTLKAWPITWKASYENPMLGSRSLFRFEEGQDMTGLKEYPELAWDDQNSLIGYQGNYSQRRHRWFNAWAGQKYHIRLYTLVWDAKKYGPEVAVRQRDHWAGGNQNEVVVCLGLDQKGTIEWARTWSWENSPKMAVGIRSYLEDTKTFQAEPYLGHVESMLKSGQWTRPEFKDFSYVSVELSDWQALVILILILAYNIGISVWIIKNEYTND